MLSSGHCGWPAANAPVGPEAPNTSIMSFGGPASARTQPGARMRFPVGHGCPKLYPPGCASVEFESEAYTTAPALRSGPRNQPGGGGGGAFKKNPRAAWLTPIVSGKNSHDAARALLRQRYFPTWVKEAWYKTPGVVGRITAIFRPDPGVGLYWRPYGAIRRMAGPDSLAAGQHLVRSSGAQWMKSIKTIGHLRICQPPFPLERRSIPYLAFGFQCHSTFVDKGRRQALLSIVGKSFGRAEDPYQVPKPLFRHVPPGGRGVAQQGAVGSPEGAAGQGLQWASGLRKSSTDRR